MRKLSIFSIVVFISMILAGMYGALHNQISYSISPEYFTKFKFQGFDPGRFGGERPTAAVIGFFSSWWVGLFAGLIWGPIALFLFDAGQMKKRLRTAIGVLMV